MSSSSTSALTRSGAQQASVSTAWPAGDELAGLAVAAQHGAVGRGDQLVVVALGLGALDRGLRGPQLGARAVEFRRRDEVLRHQVAGALVLGPRQLLARRISCTVWSRSADSMRASTCPRRDLLPLLRPSIAASRPPAARRHRHHHRGLDGAGGVHRLDRGAARRLARFRRAPATATRRFRLPPPPMRSGRWRCLFFSLQDESSIPGGASAAVWHVDCAMRPDCRAINGTHSRRPSCAWRCHAGATPDGGWLPAATGCGRPLLLHSPRRRCGEQHALVPRQRRRPGRSWRRHRHASERGGQRRRAFDWSHRGSPWSINLLELKGRAVQLTAKFLEVSHELELDSDQAGDARTPCALAGVR